MKQTFLKWGLGSGCNLWFCAREGFNYYGIEGSAVAVERAKQWFAKENLKEDLSQGNWEFKFLEIKNCKQINGSELIVFYENSSQ